MQRTIKLMRYPNGIKVLLVFGKFNQNESAFGVVLPNQVDLTLIKSSYRMMLSISMLQQVNELTRLKPECARDSDIYLGAKLKRLQFENHVVCVLLCPLPNTYTYVCKRLLEIITSTSNHTMEVSMGVPPNPEHCAFCP